MDIGMAKSTVWPMICQPRCLMGSSEEARIPSRVRCEGKERRESLKRSEVVELLSAALKTLLVPENEKRLRERLGNPRRRLTEAPSVQAPLPPHRVDRAPPEETNEISVDLLSLSASSSSSSTAAAATAFTRAREQVCAMPEAPARDEILRAPPTSGTGITADDASLSTLRRLRTLNVHSYVHNALRESFLRSHLQSRKVEE
ncbi:hypothetical protein Mapa_009791 [Marchantia paleacea]|nr:hypothetical protein Mapa_009791 [Marchantia paleacea]